MNQYLTQHGTFGSAELGPYYDNAFRAAVAKRISQENCKVILNVGWALRDQPLGVTE